MAEAGSENGTRQRLLEVASEVFAEKGFRDATNREICERAGANVAAVNYYFGSKENLYAEAWRRTFHDSLQKHPPDGGVSPDAPPVQRLRGRVKALIRQVADGDNPAFLMVYREMAAPTPLLQEVKQECVAPLAEATTELMRELLGPEVPERYVHYCAVSTVSQCVDAVGRVRLAEVRGGKQVPEPAGRHVRENIEEYADHVAAFSLAGIRAVRARFAGEGEKAACAE